MPKMKYRVMEFRVRKYSSPKTRFLSSIWTRKSKCGANAASVNISSRRQSSGSAHRVLSEWFTSLGSVPVLGEQLKKGDEIMRMCCYNSTCGPMVAYCSMWTNVLTSTKSRACELPLDEKIRYKVTKVGGSGVSARSLWSWPLNISNSRQ